jgi:hypothetical protein
MFSSCHWRIFWINWSFWPKMALLCIGVHDYLLYVTLYEKTQLKSFFRCQCLCVLLIYITCRIFCAKGISNILWVIIFWNVDHLTLRKQWFLDIFEVWIKELYWNAINFNDIRCNSKALLNIFLHFGMDEMYQGGIFTKQKKKCFETFSSPFSQNFAWWL